MAKFLITITQVNLWIGDTNLPELLLLKILPLSDCDNHFLAATFDFTTFFILLFFHGPHLFLQFGCFCVDYSLPVMLQWKIYILCWFWPINQVENCYKYTLKIVTKFWKINHFGAHETIWIFKLSMVLPWAEKVLLIILYIYSVFNPPLSKISNLAAAFGN